MTITVTAPNGATVQFPDGTDHATINDVMTKNFQADAPVTPIGDQRASTIAGLRGIPLVGAFVDKGTAALNAAAQPFTETGLSHADTFSDRYSENQPLIKTAVDKFEKDNPVGTKVGKFATGTAALAPLGMFGAGAKAMGLTGEIGPALVRAGTTFGLLNAADAGVRGGDATDVGKAGGLGALGGMGGNLLGRGLSWGATHIAAPLLAPIVNQVKARWNPQQFAEGQVARGITESGIPPNQLSLDVIQAGNEGQGAYTLADALGNSGQRMLSTVARAPGEGRTQVVNALDARQGDQGRRLASAIREGFDAPKTAEATRAGMAKANEFEATRNYGPVASDTTPIDVSAPVNVANAKISPLASDLGAAQRRLPTDLAWRTAPARDGLPGGIETQEAALADPIREALKQARSYLAAPSLTSSNVQQAFRAKTNIDQMIATATEKGQGGMVRELIPVRDALDDALGKTSFTYAQARDAYRAGQQRLEALDVGKQVGAKPGRPEDAIEQFGAIADPQGQQAFRVGYADPQISQVQNAAFGTNKAKPFTSDATKEEFNAFAAPGKADLLQRQIARENTMFETRNQAMGGSRTVDNLNDHAAMAVDPHVVTQLLTGNVHGAMSTLLRAGSNMASGNTPAVRQAVAEILLQRAPDINPRALELMVDHTVNRLNAMQATVDSISRGVGAGSTIAATPSNQRQRATSH